MENICEVHSFLGVIAFLQQCNSMLLRDRRPPNPGYPAIVKNSKMAMSFYLRLGFSHLHLVFLAYVKSAWSSLLTVEMGFGLFCL